MNILQHREKIDNLLSYLSPVIVDNDLFRLGSKNDGGYVLSKDIDKNDYLLSFGIGNNIDFEKDISPMVKGIDMYDGTVSDIPDYIDNGRFFNKNINTENNILSCINDIKEDYKDLILKMDIEEEEWNVLDHTDSNILSRFKQIIIEFHYFNQRLDTYSFFMQNNNPPYYEITKNVLKKIRDTHDPIYIHANNFSNIHIIANQVIPQVFEITYLRKDFIKNKKEHKSFPASKFDSPNALHMPDIKWVPNV